MTGVLAVCSALLMASATHVKSDIAFIDGAETIATNPARGHAGGGWVTFKPEGLPNWHGQGGYHSSLWELSRFSGGREQGGKRPKPERVGGADRPLTDAMKADVRRFLAETRAKGGSLIVRLGYTWSEQPGCEPADFEVLLGHVRELSQIMSAFEDVVVAVEAGVAGPWGEMHSSDYCAAEFMNRILTTYLEHLGPRIPVLVRAPAYFNKLAGTTTEELLAKTPFADAPLNRLGMYNDGYLGTWWDYGTWAGDFTRERGCALLTTIDRAPYGGEMAYIGRDWLEKNRDLFDLKKWNVVKDWYGTHLNYLRNITEGGHTLATFLKDDLTFTVADYAYEGLPSLAEYDGRSMSKFLMDHMGYRFVIRDARLPKEIKAKTPFVIALEVENTGFGRVLLPMRARLVYRTKAGETGSVPVNCPFDLAGGQRKRVALRCDGLPVDGPVAVYLRLACPLKDEAETEVPRRPIRFANPGIWEEELKANRLSACY